MKKTLVLSALFSVIGVGTSFGQMTRVTVTFENLAPTQGTFQTPVWVGFHDGTFDTYDQGAPASPAFERIAEDGNAAPLIGDFAASTAGTVDGLIFGPNIPPIGSGEIGSASFLLDPSLPSSRYLSYATMVIPSNDALIANGNPLAHKVFDDSGNFVGQTFFVAGDEVLDAGTEVNDEIPANTAFLAQMAPDTGVDENGTVQLHPGFLPAGTGSILSDFRFSAAVFDLPGYAMAKVRLRAAPAITDLRRYRTFPSPGEETHTVMSNARARFLARLVDSGTELEVQFIARNLRNVVAAHLHMGLPGTDGPVVATLVGPLPPGGGLFANQVSVNLGASDLQGPLLGAPLDMLSALIDAGEIYVNIHTNDGLPGDDTGPGDYASGEVRGQLNRF